MNVFKKCRDLWIFGGICFALVCVIDVLDKSSISIMIIHIICCLIYFINAYINHKKYIKSINKDKK